YNFFFRQSKAEDDPKNFAVYRQQMFNSYLKYFTENYEGNRAPVHIGHHFAQYQGGVYSEALLAFATRVCSLPEVKCATYSELRGFLAKVKPETLRAYQQGDSPRQELASFDSTIELPKSSHHPRLALKVKKNRQLAVGLENAARNERRSSPEWIVDGRSM